MAGASELLGSHRHQQQRRRRQTELSADSRLARQVYARRSVQRLDVQPEADWRAVLRRGPARQPARCPTTNTSRRAISAATAPTPRRLPAATPASSCRPRPAKISGIAPRARIATYKVCFDNGAGLGTCFNSDSVAAIDQAVIDGVDVINFSIGGTSTFFTNVVEVAFFNAAEAGVFVAAAGRQQRSHRQHGRASLALDHDGRGDHPSAERDHDDHARQRRDLHRRLDGGGHAGAADGAVGGGRTAERRQPGDAGQRDRPLLLRDARSGEGGRHGWWSAIAGSTRASTRVSRWPWPAARRWCSRTSWPGTLDADFHSVPTIHVDPADGAAIKAYAAGANPTGRLAAAVITPTGPPAGDRELLVARAGARGGRRSAQARRQRARRQRHGGRRASRQRWRAVRALSGHVDGQPARGRPRGAVQAAASGLVADDDQVGADDDRDPDDRCRQYGSRSTPGPVSSIPPPR